MSCVFNGTTSTFKYGADGLRRQATVNGVTTDYVYDGSTLIREGHASGGTLTAANVTATYLTGPRGPEYRRDDTATELDSQGRTVSKCRWYVYDGLGSVVGEVDPSGNLTSNPKYDVYGLVRSNGGTASSKMVFVGSLGHLSEANTGLIYMRARYYDPNNGRFSSEDPSGNGTNWFVYCGDNPITRADASGKSWEVDFIKEIWAFIQFCVKNGVNPVKDIRNLITAYKMGATTEAAEAGALTADADKRKVAGDDLNASIEGGAAGRTALSAATDAAKEEMLQMMDEYLESGVDDDFDSGVF